MALFSSYRFPTSTLMRGVGAPVLVMHGDRDGVIPFELGRALFDSLDGPVMRVAAPDVPAMPFNTPQEDFFMPSPAKIAAAMRQLAAY